MKLPSVGIIGAGSRGLQLSRICAKYDSLGAVAEILPDRLRKMRSEFPDIEVRSSWRKIFASDVDAVAIATPLHTHVRFALEAIACGKHVFVEKPLAMSEEGAIAVASKAERAGRSVFVGHDLLYHPAIVAGRALVESGTIGDIIHIRARRFRPAVFRTSDNVWWRLAPDDVALIVELLGEPLSVTASHQIRAQGAITDFVYADLQFRGDRSAHVEVAWRDPGDSSRIDIFGTRGTASVETTQRIPRLSVRRSRSAKACRKAVSLDLDAPSVQQFPDADALETSLLAFLRSFNGPDTPISNITHGVATVRAMAAVMRAGACGSRQFVVNDTSQYLFVTS